MIRRGENKCRVCGKFAKGKEYQTINGEQLYYCSKHEAHGEVARMLLNGPVLSPETAPNKYTIIGTSSDGGSILVTESTVSPMICTSIKLKGLI